MFAPDPRLKTAIELFHGGRFGDSIGCCEALWAEGVRSLPLQALLGELRLWQNRPSEAAGLLAAALAEQRDSVRLKAILAESYRRSDRLPEAAALYRELGRVSLAAKLDSAAGPGWYRLDAPADGVELPWVGVGNLPVHVHETRSSMAELLPFPVDGVIGSGLLSRLPATLDYGRRRLQLGGDQSVENGTPFYLASDQYPLVPARINDRLDTLLLLDTGMAGTGLALPMSTARAANVEVLVDAEGIGYGVQNTLSATPIVCRSVSAAGLERRDLQGMLLARFRLEHQFGFRIGGLLGDGFIGNGRLRIDFAAMRVSVEE